jgi:tRNA threonylcarbamoyladenosine biosynthesis protein TsaB
MTSCSAPIETFAVADAAAAAVEGLLAFDASLGALSVAVVPRRHSRVAHEAFETRATGHAEHLMPMIGRVMEDAGVGFSELSHIAVTVGPGGFTGVRVGIAAARALALATGRPVAGFTSLAVLAEEARRLLPAPTQGPLAVAIATRRGMVFFQIFDAEGKAASPERHISPGDASQLVGARRLLIVGSGAQAVAAAGCAAGTALPELQPRARALVALVAAGVATRPARPLYLAPHGAQPPGAGSAP